MTQIWVTAGEIRGVNKVYVCGVLFFILMGDSHVKHTYLRVLLHMLMGVIALAIAVKTWPACIMSLSLCDYIACTRLIDNSEVKWREKPNPEDKYWRQSQKG